MDDGLGIVIATFAALLIGVPVLAAIMYGAFCAGEKLFNRFGKSMRHSLAVPAICLLNIPVFLIGQLIPGTPFAKAVVGLLLYLLHSYPMVVGFIVRRTKYEEDSNRRFKKNVDDWLADWECADAVGESSGRTVDPESGKSD